MLWNQGVKKTCILLDLAIAADRNVTQKEGIRKLKYKILCIEVQVCKKECMILLVIIGAMGVVTNGLKKSKEATPEKHSVDSIQKTAKLRT
jgi:hypothetical protein